MSRWRRVLSFEPVNRLKDESSLYLRQHADNPVHWHAWGDAAFEEARERDVPVLLSVGYSSCHWCHVMAHESFEDDETATLMNELFVNVKVDREERPDVDALYMQATIALSGGGGWPMTVFMTPEGKPFYAGTYFPPTARNGLPGFRDVLWGLSDAYACRREVVAGQADRITDQIAEAAARRADPEALTPEILDEAIVGLARVFDPVEGGFGGAPKFPPSVSLEFLIRRMKAGDADRHVQQIVDLTMAKMAAGGIYDQVGGGFHRYSVDNVWLVPHFEKMLYDNALLAGDYALAFTLGGSPEARRIAEETLDYLLREMRAPDGGFAAAQDADTPEGEGAYFTWTPDSLAEVLDVLEVRAVRARYGVTPQGNFENNTTILRGVAPIAAVSQEIGEDAAPVLARALTKLREARGRRTPPARDDKVIASWNGLAIASFAVAGIALDRPDYVEAARDAAAFVLDHLVVDERLRRTYADGEAHHLGQLDDHANVCHGLLALYEATFEPRWLDAARDLADAMIDLFADTERGGFYQAGADGPELVARTRDLEDNPAPGGNSQAAWVLVRIAALTGSRQLPALAEAALRLVRDEMASVPQAFSTALTALDFQVNDSVEIAIVGPLDDERTKALSDVARTDAGPRAVIAAGSPDDAAAVEAAPLLEDRPLVDGAPAAYVCRAFACRAPVTTPEALRAELGPDVGAEPQTAEG